MRLDSGTGDKLERNFAEGYIAPSGEGAGGGGILPGLFPPQSMFEVDGGDGAAEPVAGTERREQRRRAVGAAGEADEQGLTGKRGKKLIAIFKLHL